MYLEGSEAEFKDDLDALHVFVSPLHHVGEHHVVHPEQRDQQEGGLRQTSGGQTQRNNKYAEIMRIYLEFMP